MGKEISTFGNIEIEKIRFTARKVKKALASNKISSSEKNYKCFIGYFYNDHKVKPLHIMLPKTSAYGKSYNGQTKWMYFLIEDDDFYKIIIQFGIKSVLSIRKIF